LQDKQPNVSSKPGVISRTSKGVYVIAGKWVGRGRSQALWLHVRPGKKTGSKKFAQTINQMSYFL
jgi:hypothetical protein